MIFSNLNLHYIFKLLKVYYSPQGYWKGLAAIKKLAAAAKVSDDAAKKWVIKQTLENLSCRPKFDVPMTNAVHQADLFLSHDIQGYGQGWKTYKCALTVVDVASHFKEAEPLTLKDSTEVASSFQKIINASL